MSNLKRMISLVLVLVLVVGLVPAANAAQPEATVDTNKLSIEGTNGFGNLLSQEITEQQEQTEEQAEAYPAGYTVTDLEIEGSTATVTYDSMEEATLVVALYTEDGMRMVTSATAAVTPEATTATVALGDDMPEYFLASAYLLDNYDLSPLCAAYDTPMYTQEMQELLASTVDDYDEDKVLNLDEDETTNFAVYAETTIVIEPVEGVNTVFSADEETQTYVIKNANEQVLSLVEGNVFVYPYAEQEILIVKIAAISIDGTTVTITGGELSLEEAFAYMKVEGDAGNEQMTVDDSTAADGITYVGLTEEPVSPQAWEGGGGATASHEFKLDLEKKHESDHLDASFKVEGSLNVQIDVSLNYYISLSRQFLEFKADPSLKLGVSISGNVTGKFPIGDFGFSPVAGVYVGFAPEIQLGFSGEASLSAEASMTIGLAYSSDKGFENLCTKPKVKFSLNVEGTLFFGVDFVPNARIISKKVASLELTTEVGFELTAKMSGTAFEIFETDAERRHTCTACLGLDIAFKSELGGELKFLDLDWLTLKVSPMKLSFDLGSFHRSSEETEFKKGGCKNYTYRITVLVRDEDDAVVEGATVIADDQTLNTNSRGIAVFYLPTKTYTITASYGELSKSKELTVEEAEKLTIRFGEDAENRFSGILGNVTSGDYTDFDNAIEQPYAEFNGHTYTLFSNAASSWDEALAYCESMGGHLATITSAEENEFLYNYMRSCDFENAYWGLTDRNTEGVWEWCTGEPFVYMNWASGEPNDDHYGQEDYGMYWKGRPDGYWNDGRFGDDGQAFLCEWDYLLPQNVRTGQEITPNAVYPGDYGTEVTEEYTLKTATFTGLAPNEQYVLLAMVSIEVEDPLASDNLLFIDQAAALEDGTLEFRYVQRTPCEISYVMACGASHKNLKDAEITFPKMVADGELQVVDPVVVYDGETLTEGQDYVIVGKVDFTDAGTYTCTIRGIHNYTGLVACEYSVVELENPFGDVEAGSFFYEPVLWAVENGITTGTSPTTFGPNDQCMRAQVVTFLWRAIGSPDPEITNNPFVDVKEGDFFYKPVLWAVKNHITTGIDDTHFGSTAFCNRAQVVTFLWRAVGSPDPEITNNPFVDVKEGDFFYKPVLWAVENGITTGLDANLFGPGATCNRAQVVTFLYRTFVN